MDGNLKHYLMPEVSLQNAPSTRDHSEVMEKRTFKVAVHQEPKLLITQKTHSSEEEWIETTTPNGSSSSSFFTLSADCSQRDFVVRFEALPDYDEIESSGSNRLHLRHLKSDIQDQTICLAAVAYSELLSLGNAEMTSNTAAYPRPGKWTSAHLNSILQHGHRLYVRHLNSEYSTIVDLKTLQEERGFQANRLLLQRFSTATDPDQQSSLVRFCPLETAEGYPSEEYSGLVEKDSNPLNKGGLEGMLHSFIMDVRGLQTRHCTRYGLLTIRGRARLVWRDYEGTRVGAGEDEEGDDEDNRRYFLFDPSAASPEQNTAVLIKASTVAGLYEAIKSLIGLQESELSKVEYTLSLVLLVHGDKVFRCPNFIRRIMMSVLCQGRRRRYQQQYPHLKYRMLPLQLQLPLQLPKVFPLRWRWMPKMIMSKRRRSMRKMLMRRMSRMRKLMAKRWKLMAKKRMLMMRKLMAKKRMPMPTMMMPRMRKLMAKKEEADGEKMDEDDDDDVEDEEADDEEEEADDDDDADADDDDGDRRWNIAAIYDSRKVATDNGDEETQYLVGWENVGDTAYPNTWNWQADIEGFGGAGLLELYRGFMYLFEVEWTRRWRANGGHLIPLRDYMIGLDNVCDDLQRVFPNENYAVELRVVAHRAFDGLSEQQQRDLLPRLVYAYERMIATEEAAQAAPTAEQAQDWREGNDDWYGAADYLLLAKYYTEQLNEQLLQEEARNG
ncbi:hypothetical protein TYRP_022209 [Tyrophagus putrescentiae]|nr:hypothetical protein TYRP_022209 [Tyrophagus putrescentiae]